MNKHIALQRADAGWKCPSAEWHQLCLGAGDCGGLSGTGIPEGNGDHAAGRQYFRHGNGEGFGFVRLQGDRAVKSAAAAR